MVIENLDQRKDYEEFAMNYLGIDLEDYVELICDSEVPAKELDASLSY